MRCALGSVGRIRLHAGVITNPYSVGMRSFVPKSPGPDLRNDVERAIVYQGTCESGTRNMTNSDRHHSARARAVAQERISKITRAVVLAAIGGTAFIGVVVAKEHPGAGSAAASGTAPAVAPSGGGDDGPSNSDNASSGSSSTNQPSPTITNNPTPTNNPPVATSGGTSR